MEAGGRGGEALVLTIGLGKELHTCRVTMRSGGLASELRRIFKNDLL